MNQQKQNESTLCLSEFISHTIQGEGIYVGCPATFLRLSKCHLNCVWCDTKELNNKAEDYSINELLSLIGTDDLPGKFRQGQHLVITGGSPLLQQDGLVRFILQFISKYHFKPFIEIENECTIMPKGILIVNVDCWDNSPKLASSQVPTKIRYQPEIIRFMSQLENSWFKFVISGEGDWNEIEALYLETELIKKEQVILMPQGSTRDELLKNQEKVANIAIIQGVRYSPREHIMIWDRRSGI